MKISDLTLETKIDFLGSFLDHIRRNTTDGWKLPPFEEVWSYVRAQYTSEGNVINLDAFEWRYSVLLFALFQHHEYACHNSHFHISFTDFYNCRATTFNEVQEMLQNAMRELRLRSGA